MTKSNVWFVAHLQRNFPRGYRDLPMHEIFKLRSKVYDIMFKFEGNVDFKRVYIPKSGKPNEGRPLGVPSPEGRVYLSMLNTVLVIWLEPGWQEHQHAYLPGRGTLTVGREILKRIEAADIYEFDLKQFFPNVEICNISRILEERGMPKGWVYYIENLNKSKPKLTDKDLTDESQLREVEEIKKGILSKKQSWYKPVQRFIDDNGEELLIEFVMQDVGRGDLEAIFEFVQLQHAMFSSFNPVQPFHGMMKGLPQGGSISPTLSVQALDPIFYLNSNKTVMYADDGLFFGSKNPVLKAEEYDRAGIVFHPEKGGWVKQNGRWLKPLKFCGLTYDGWADKLYSSTRNGKYEEITRDRLSELVNGKVETYSGLKTSKWHELMEDKLSGFIQACLYSGTFELNTNTEEGDMTISRGSGLDSKASKLRARREKVKLGLHNSSSIATKGLLDKIRKPRAATKVDPNKLPGGVTEEMAKSMNGDAKRLWAYSKQLLAEYRSYGNRSLYTNAAKDLTKDDGTREEENPSAKPEKPPAYADVVKHYTKRERNLLRAYKYLKDNGQGELATQVWEEFKRNKHAKPDTKEYEEIETPDGPLRIEKDQ